MSTYDQGNVKVFCENFEGAETEHLAQQIFPHLR